MQNHEPQPGDRVALIEGNPAGLGHFEQALSNARQLTVIRQMPYDVGMFELSDGSLYAASSLHLIERAGADVEVEHVQLADSSIAVHLKPSPSAAPEPVDQPARRR